MILSAFIALSLLFLSGSLNTKNQNSIEKNFTNLINFNSNIKTLIYKNTDGIGYKSTNTVSDKDIYHLGDLNGAFPQRLRYSSSPYNTNSANTEAANAIQGPDKQATKLWWAK